MKPVKILWRSKHPPTKRHRELIQEIYPGRDLDIVEDSAWIAHADHVVQQFKSGNYDDIFINTSWTVLDVIANTGVSPLIAITEECSKEDADFFDGRAHKRVINIRRFKRLIIDEVEAKPFETRL